MKKSENPWNIVVYKKKRGVRVDTTIYTKGGNSMKKNTTAKRITKVLDAVLKTEANSASCVLAYQPKEPKSLDRFKKIKW